VIEIEVQGFQSIAHATIKVEGFTALVGRSNIGKSAFVRAVRSALTNPVGTSFVRHRRDCSRQTSKKKTCDCQATVHIRADGFDLMWEKGDKVNRYTFNGKEYDKPERGTPDFLSDTGFSSIKLGDKSAFLQVANQFSPIFLLDSPGTTVAETISDASKLDCINSATKLVEKERRDTASKRKVREEDIAALEERASGFESLDRDLEPLRRTEDTLAQIENLAKKRDELARFLSLLVGIKQSLQVLEAASKVGSPDESVLATLPRKVSQLYGYMNDLLRREESVAKLSGLDNVVIEFDSTGLTNGESTAIKLFGWFNQLKAAKSKMEGFEGVSGIEVSDTDLLTSALTKVGAERGFSLRMAPLTSEVTSLEQSAQRLESEEKKVQESMGAIEFCPTCERPVREGHAHAEAIVSI
jgi:hypothetical protein